MDAITIEKSSELFELDDVKRSVAEVRQLLRHANQTGRTVDPDILRAIVQAEGGLEAGHVPQAAVVEFRDAYSRLAASLVPVTLDTLTVSEDVAYRGLKRNGIFSILLAVIVVVFSIVTFVTTSMSDEIAQSIVHANKLAADLRVQVGAPKPGNSAEMECGPAQGPPMPEIKIADERMLVSQLQDFASTIRTLLKTATKLNLFVAWWERSPLDADPSGPELWTKRATQALQLEPGLINMRKDTMCKISAYQDVREFAQNVRNASVIVYGAIAAYLLPVLYALLGAFAYNLRDFSERVKTRTFHPSSYANTARTIAAMTAGAIISLFNNFSEGTGLKPLAIAFLVGYGVEAFFAFLDTLLLAFRRTSPPVTPPARAATPSSV